MILRYLFILVVFLLVTACGTTVNVDYDKQTNFNSLKSFTLMPSSEIKTGDERLDSPLVDQRIRKAILATLKMRGLSASEKQSRFCCCVSTRRPFQKSIAVVPA